MRLSLGFALFLVACQSSSSSGTTPVPSETAAPPAPSASVVASASAAPSASAPTEKHESAAASASAAKPSDGKPTSVVACKVKVGASSIATQFDMDKQPMTGTVTIDGPDFTAHRAFKIHATPSAGTYIFLFDSYGEGDVKPAGEKLTKESIVTRQVTKGKFDQLFFDGDVKLAPKSGKLPDLICGE